MKDLLKQDPMGEREAPLQKGEEVFEKGLKEILFLTAAGNRK